MGRTERASSRFPVVGIGASAGGLEAFTQLLSHLPPDTGMAFVFVSHLDPTHESMLSEILSRSTPMLVREVENGMRIEPNSVYVIPPNFGMEVLDGGFRLVPRPADQARRMPVDQFLSSIAREYQSRAMGVILSGTNADGTVGLRAIKAEGGIAFAQSENTARFPEMPRAAVASGCVDYVLPPDRIAREIARLGRHPSIATAPADRETRPPPGQELLAGIFTLLKNATGVDFSNYRLTTIRRRIGRRMALNKIEGLEGYVRFLRANPQEVHALYEDLLITVTTFFRDSDTFRLLAARILPKILKNRTADAPVRIWIPGCSTGEEVYSLAIVLFESLAATATYPPIQIFASDVSERALQKARLGVYTDNEVVDVSKDRLRRFFVKVEKGHQISKTIRDVCVFARQNIAADPPFSNLDLLSCRNLLIYLEPVLQKRIFPLFHYALKPNGYLVLGAAEAVGSFSDLFAPIGKNLRIFEKKPGIRRPAVEFAPARSPGGAPPATGERPGSDVSREADRLMLGRFSPPAVLVNEKLDIIQFRGQTGPYLEPAAGTASLSLLRMAREGLFLELRSLIQKARRSRDRVRGEGIGIRRSGQTRTVNVEIVPLGDGRQDRHYLVLFEEEETQTASSSRRGAESKVAARSRARENRGVARLESELLATKDYLQSVIEEQEASNEELKSANEEILSSNEELQSTNEELETAKEELQSTNEELTTVNEELQNRNAQLAEAIADLSNILSSVNIPILLVGRGCEIRRYTPPAEKLLNLMPSDIGRPLKDMKASFTGADAADYALEVIETVTTKEREVRDSEGHWYLMRVRPYRTEDDRIEGAVIAFINIDPVKRILEEASAARFYAEALVETIRESLIVLDEQLRVKTANQAFYSTFQLTPLQSGGKRIFELEDWQWTSEWRDRLERVLSHNARFDEEVERDFRRAGRKTLQVHARPIHIPGETKPSILLSVEDLSDRRLAERELRTSEARYRQIFESAREGIWLLDADGGEILDVNPFLVELFGYSRGELVGRKPWELALYDEPERARSRFEALKVAGYSYDSEIVMLARSGSRVLIEAISNVTTTGHKRVVQCNMRDLTERKRLEEELRQIQKMESIGRLVSGLSHDFNNILNIISAYSGLIERGDPKKRNECLQAINKAVQRGAGVVRQLLTFARKDGISFQPVRVNDVVRECGEIVSETFPRKIELSIDLQPKLPPIKADPNQLHQALLNLCVNARDAMPEGGTLRITTSLLDGSKVRDRFPDAPGERYVRLTVSDTGVGIDDATRGRVFEPFFTTKGTGEGSGLGLPVVYGIVQGHGGYVALESEPGRGTTFEILLPVSDLLAGERERLVEEAPAPRRGSERILLVEDEEMLRNSVRSLLELEGYSVLTAGDGLEAVEIYREHFAEIDLVVFDQELPRLSGWEAFCRMKEFNPGLDAILASGYVDRDRQSEMLEGGARAVVRKPYTAEGILSKVREVIDSSPRTTSRPPASSPARRRRKR